MMKSSPEKKHFLLKNKGQQGGAVVIAVASQRKGCRFASLDGVHVLAYLVTLNTCG